MARISLYDTEQWLKKIMEVNGTTFTFTELKKYGLNDKRFLFRAICKNLVTKIKKVTSKKYYFIYKWEIKTKNIRKRKKV